MPNSFQHSSALIEQLKKLLFAHAASGARANAFTQTFLAAMSSCVFAAVSSPAWITPLIVAVPSSVPPVSFVVLFTMPFWNGKKVSTAISISVAKSPTYRKRPCSLLPAMTGTIYHNAVRNLAGESGVGMGVGVGVRVGENKPRPKTGWERMRVSLKNSHTLIDMAKIS